MWCMAVIPMAPGIEVEKRLAERVATMKTGLTKWLTERKKAEPDAAEYAHPLPLYAHENSRELELVVEHFKAYWSNIVIRRAWNCLYIVFVR